MVQFGDGLRRRGTRRSGGWRRRRRWRRWRRAGGDIALRCAALLLLLFYARSRRPLVLLETRRFGVDRTGDVVVGSHLPRRRDIFPHRRPVGTTGRISPGSNIQLAGADQRLMCTGAERMKCHGRVEPVVWSPSLTDVDTKITTNLLEAGGQTRLSRQSDVTGAGQLSQA
ncbi:unnamed protein product [Merluccius merluccius]